MPRTVPAAYKHSLWMRGLSPAELHRRYKFSKPLLAAFAKGREVSTGSMVRLAAVLKAHPPIPELVEVLAVEGDGKENHQGLDSLVVEEDERATTRLQDTA